MPDRGDPTRLGVSDATRVDAAFAHPAFAPLKAAGASFALGVGEPPRLAWANRAALRTFRSFADAQAALFGAGGAASRLPAEPRTFASDGHPRLARVALPSRFATPGVTVLYRRAAGPTGEPALALAVLPSGMGQGAPRTAPSGTAPNWRDGVEAGEDGGAASPRVAAAGEASRPGGGAARAPGDGNAAVHAARFLWRTDAGGLVSAFEGASLRALGATGLPSIAHAMTEAVAAFDPDGAERLRRSLSHPATWSGVELLWPTSDGRPRVPVVLSAAPVFGAGRSFEGFRGFGIARDPGRPAGARDETAGRNGGSRAAPPATGQEALVGRDGDRDGGQPPPSNVVHLRPAATGAPPVHAGAPAGGGGVSDGAAERSPFLLAASHEAGARTGPNFRAQDAPVPAAGNAAAVGSLAGGRGRPGGGVPTGDLTSDEQEAFHEIGLRLGGADGLGPDLPDGSPASEGAKAHDRRDPSPEVVRRPDPAAVHAAADAARDAGAFEREVGDARELRAMLEGTGDGVGILDEGSRILALNGHADHVFGREPGARAKDVFTALLAPESRAAAAALFAALRDDPEGAGYRRRDVLGRSSGGRRVPLSMTLGRLGPGRFYALWRAAPAAVPAGIAASLSPPARPGRGDPGVLARISHEIRGPLNAILGFAEIMLDERFGSLGNPRAKGYLQDIHASGTRVLTLVDDLVDLSRIEAGGDDLDPGPLDINKLIGEAVALTQAQAHRERIIMRTSLASRLPPALADERSARQILSNLLSNAVKFNEPGGQVIVSSAVSETGQVAVRIRDTGIGMSDEVLANALEPFHARSAGPGAGTRLGLPVTKALVGANGATLAIRSRPNEGTLVEVVFPAASAPATRVPA